MRIVRIVLQILLVALSLPMFAALFRSPFELKGLLIVAGFCVFMFLLTLLLREHTESRLVAGRTVSSRVIGAFLAFVGLGICAIAAGIVLGDIGSTGQRRWLAFVIDLVGPWPPAVVFALVGLDLLYIGYRAFRAG